MLELNATIKGDRVVIDDIEELARNYPEAIKRGLGSIVIGVHREAVANLSGPGIKKSNIPGGGYPVPVRTGHLRRSENFVLPGRTKTTGGLAFSAGPLSAILYNSAEYSRVIHEGRGSSRKYGKRPYQTDAVETYDRQGKLIGDLDREIQKEMRKL